MIVGLGMDLADSRRIGRLVDRYGDAFTRRIFTPGELESCANRRDRDLALAARFAAKEACVKALGTGWRDGVSFGQVEVVRDGGPPGLRLTGGARALADARGVTDIHLTMTHDGAMAAATVILEGEDVLVTPRLP